MWKCSMGMYDKMQYSERIDLLSDWDVLDILAESIDENSIGSEDFKVLHDFANKRKLLKEYYINKVMYDKSRYLWHRGWYINSEINEITTELNAFCESNS